MTLDSSQDRVGDDTSRRAQRGQRIAVLEVSGGETLVSLDV